MRRILFYILPILFLSACDDFLTVESDTSVTDINYWKTESDLDAATNALYQTFRKFLGGDVSLQYRDRGLIFDGLGSWANPSNNDLSAWSPSDSRISWNWLYDVINEANLILDNINRATLTTERYDFYKGQVLGLRAYTYFYILQNWGDAPLVLHCEDVGEKARTKWPIIADQCITDLKEAAALLPVAKNLKDIKGNTIVSKQVVSKGTCFATLAHLYAWKATLNKEPNLNKIAKLYCDSVISDNSYGLVNDSKEVCELVIRGNSKEGILECDFENTENDMKAGGSFLASFSQFWPIVPLTTPSSPRRGLLISNNTVYKMYPDKDDQRRQEYFYKLDSMAKVPVSTTKGNAYPQKYRHVIKYEDGNQIGKLKTYNDNEILIRLADIILLRAELRTKNGDNTGAIEDLNRIRERAGCSPYTAGDLANEIQNERERELFMEGITIRYFDCIRNGTFRERLRGKFKTLTDQEVEEGALFLPVARPAFNNNTLMQQTIYWKKNGYNY